MTIEQQVKDALVQAFAEQSTPGYSTSGVGQAFFRVWMKERGHAYFFLFRKNLRVTNIQFAELLALVSKNSWDVATGEMPTSLQFVSSEEFADTVQGLLEAFDTESSASEDLAEKSAELYTHLLRNTVVVDAFFGSCSVYLPPHLDVDLKSICGLSGYIHSCGRNVFLRNVTKVTEGHFLEALARYLKRFPPESKRIFFTVYAHEDFTEFDEEQRSKLRHGLDDVKIHVDKFFLGSVHLVDVLKKIRDRFQDDVAIPDPGDFRSQHRRLRQEADIDQDRTMWLISDFGIDQRHPAESRYLICYDQLFDNKNPFHIFDENKPAWVEHTTIPHTLIGAMINITLPHWPAGRVSGCDPFVGTGTTWLEATKFSDLSLRAADQDSLACLAARDNAEFFSMAPNRIKETVEQLMQVAKSLEGNSSVEGAHRAEADIRAGLLRAWIGLSASAAEERAREEIPERAHLIERLLLYVALRTNKRHAPGLRRGSEEWGKAFSHEASVLCKQMMELANLGERNREDAGNTLSISTGGYSRSVSFSSSSVARLYERAVRGDLPHVSDARELGGANQFDIIVTDPPYAFNTEGSPEDLARLYAHFLRAAIVSLKSDGQLVLCLPESSSIGKTPLRFTHRKIVTHQVLALAEEVNREVLLPARSLPGAPTIFGPPYFWASEKALRRSILHFRIRDPR